MAGEVARPEKYESAVCERPYRAISIVTRWGPAVAG